MKKMRKTKMRSKKNVRKTKRIRGGAASEAQSGTKRKLNNGNGNNNQKNSKRMGIGEMAISAARSARRGVARALYGNGYFLNEQFQEAMRNYENAVEAAKKDFTTINEQGTYVDEKSVKSDARVIHALHVLNEIDKQIRHLFASVSHRTKVQPEESKKHNEAKEEFMNDMKDHTIFKIMHA